MEFFFKKEKIKYKIFNHGYYSSAFVIATKKSAFWYFKYLFIHKGSLIHFHQFFKFHFLYYYIFSKLTGKKIFISIHDDKIINFSPLLKTICFWLLKNTKATELICVSKNLSGMLKEIGIENTWLPATVPPNNLSPVKLKKIADREYFLFSIWKLEKKMADSVYNIELAMKLLSIIKAQFHMLFLVGSEEESDKEYLLHLIEKYGVADSITIIYEANLVNYLNNCKFFLRTNNIDGYGVSIQEAIDLKVPAIASDVCIRPRGAILFKKGNIDDLLEKVLNINKYWKESEAEISDFHLRLLEMYKKHLDK